MPNVNGPSGPRGPVPTTGPASTTNATPTQPLPDAPAPQPNRAWGATAAGATAPKNDGFGGVPARRTGPSLDGLNPVSSPVLSNSSAATYPYQQQVATALDKYTGALNDTLHLDPSASDLSKGVRPFQNGDALSADQQSKLQGATVDLLKSIPIGAMAPGVAQTVQSALQNAGLPVNDLAGKSLDQLGDVGANIAKQLASQLKDKSPAAYYGVAAAGAAAIAYEGWAGGSAGLEKLGVKPELSKGFFDDQLKVKVGAAWDPHFKNISGQASVEGNFDVTDHLKLSGTAVYDTRAGMQSASAGFVYQPRDDFKLSGNVSHDFNTGVTSANAEADWKVRQNVDFALSGSVDNRGNSQVGVGLKISF